MAVFLLGRGGVTSGTVVTPLTEIPHVSYNWNIMRVRAALRALATGWDPRQTNHVCYKNRVYGPGAKGGLTPTGNIEE